MGRQPWALSLPDKVQAWAQSTCPELSAQGLVPLPGAGPARCHGGLRPSPHPGPARTGWGWGWGREKRAGWRRERGPGRRSSLVPGITVFVQAMSATCQTHACARGVLHCPPRADGVEAGTQALPSPQGLTLCDRQHQIRPAPRQGWQAISRTGAGDRG